MPWLWFLIERSLRSKRRRERTHLLEAKLYQCDVTRLDFARPRGFVYEPGDYLFVRLPDVARHKWHPFTLTNAPEQADRLTIHVRTAGDWTSTVRDRISAHSSGFAICSSDWNAQTRAGCSRSIRS